MNLANAQLILVEDSPEEAELVLLALKSNAFIKEIVQLEDGADALDYFFGNGKYSGQKSLGSPKLILLDLNMPKIGGLDVLKKLKSDERTKHFPVVVMTSSNQERDIVESYKLGVNSYVVKPVVFEEFANVISKIANYWLNMNQLPSGI